MNIYRGDIYYVENGKYLHIDTQVNTIARPAVIVSNDKCNSYSEDCTVVFLTTKDNRPDIPTHVPVLCKVPSTALCETVCRVAQNRIGEFVRACTAAEMEAIDKALMVQLGIEAPAAPQVNVEALRDDYNNAMGALESSEAKRIGLEKEIERYRTQRDAKIAELEALLEAEKADGTAYLSRITELEAYRDSLLAERKNLKERVDELTNDVSRLEKAGGELVSNTDLYIEMTKAQTERDVYKAMFGELLGRL